MLGLSCLEHYLWNTRINGYLYLHNGQSCREGLGQKSGRIGGRRGDGGWEKRVSMGLIVSHKTAKKKIAFGQEKVQL